MLRFPSLRDASEQAARVAVRFPLTLLLAASAMVAGWFLIGRPSPDLDILRWLGASALGISLSVAGTLWAERRGFTGGRRRLVDVAVLVLLGLVWWAWRDWTEEIAARRYVQYALAGHLLASFLPYLGAREPNGFWQYNRRLLLRFLLAALYSGVLFAGLAVALAALDKLLGVHISGNTYGRLWMTVAFGFHPWFFLGGVPARLSDLEEDRRYPGALKGFSQFILLPIVTVYLAILTLYLGKVLVTHNWPSGWIGYLVSSVGAVGMFSLLLVYPIEERPENRWIRTYARSFYVVLAPAIVMLLLAIGKRIQQYGISENRYFLVVLALWLAAMAVVFGGVRSRRIAIVPISLGVLALLTSFGPWGAYTVSRKSQSARLERLFTASGMFEAGRTRPAPGSVSVDNRREMSAGLEYLLRTHGPESVADWFEGGIPAPDSTAVRGGGPRGESAETARTLLAGLGVVYVDRWVGPQGPEIAFNAKPGSDVLSVRGYDVVVRCEQPLPLETAFEGHTLGFRVSADTSALEVTRDGTLLVALPLGEIRKVLLEGRTDPSRPAAEAPLEIRGESEGVSIRARIRNVNGREADGKLVIDHLVADFLLRFAP